MTIPGVISPVVLWVSGGLAIFGTVGTLILLVLTWKQYRQSQREPE